VGCAAQGGGAHRRGCARQRLTVLDLELALLGARRRPRPLSFRKAARSKIPFEYRAPHPITRPQPAKKQAVPDKLSAFFERHSGLGWM
jgi:hypothetical protein